MGASCPEPGAFKEFYEIHIHLRCASFMIDQFPVWEAYLNGNNTSGVDMTIMDEIRPLHQKMPSLRCFGLGGYSDDI